jgi:hypothetical protein
VVRALLARRVRAGTAVAGNADVETLQVDALRLELPAKIVAGMLQELSGLVRVRGDARDQPVGRRGQVDLDAAELRRAERQARVRDTASLRDADGVLDSLGGLGEANAG